MKKVPIMEARTAALLTAFAVGLGMAVHPFFFVLALIVLLVVAVEWTAEKACEYLQEFRRAYRHG
jgi:uncharacterized protein (DUF2062 family)